MKIDYANPAKGDRNNLRLRTAENKSLAFEDDRRFLFILLNGLDCAIPASALKRCSSGIPV